MATMGKSAITLNRQIAVEPLGPGRYCSAINPTAMGTLTPTVFGGNVLAIAVNASYQTVSDSHHIYSICGHFVNAATADRRLLCDVEIIKNTKAFQTRHVRVSQETDDGSTRLCLLASADFHIAEPRSMVTYSSPPQSASNPSSISSQRTQAEEFGLYKHIERFTDTQKISANSNNDNDDKNPGSADAPLKVSAEKFRALGHLQNEADHLSALSFYMDRGLAHIPAKHSGYELFEASACATLDFSLRFFTHEINLHDWHIMELKALVAENARAFGEGRVWDDKGRLLASMTQQTLLRPLPDFKPRI